jgi:ligand-binding SRPBCC domain-containing protein
MSVYTIRREQRLPISLEKAWQFFSSPKNLSNITPAYMRFKILSDPEFLEQAYPGQIITYTVRPILGIPLFWMTEITHVEKERFFVDDQRVGPYRIWHHQHHFEAIPGGVKMIDLIHYQLPLGFLGTIAYHLFVRKQLEDVFDYRYQKLEEVFGKMPA